MTKLGNVSSDVEVERFLDVKDQSTSLDVGSSVFPVNAVVLNRWSRFIDGKPGFLDDCYIDVERFQSRRQLL